VVLGISIDMPDAAARLAKDLNLPFAILSDPRMEVIRAYGMKGEGMDMADMGYVVIDKQGRVALRAVGGRDFDSPAVAAQIKAPVLGLYGGKDQGIPLDDVESMRDALKKGGSKSQIHIYPDAPHAFHADYRPSYRKDAAEDGWQRMLDWLRKNGV